MKKSEFYLRDAIFREDLGSFIGKTFETLNPSTDYRHNWHIELISDRLKQAYEGKIQRLIINMPPRNLKSICASVAWPAWILGNNPAARIIVASYSQMLSIKHSVDARMIMKTEWYNNSFKDTLVLKNQDEKAKFMTSKHGFRFATSIGGSLTGEGGDFLIVDDPHSPLQAASEVRRNGAINWFEQTFMSRLNDKNKGVVVVVMQRLHPADLTGYLLDKAGTNWEHLCLPAISECDTVFHFMDMQKVFKQGDILHPAREGKDILDRIKAELGTFAFAAQYLQRPILTKGAMVEIEWFKRYRAEPSGKIVQSWDTAIKAGVKNDYSVCTTWCETDQSYYLLDVLRMKAEYPQLKRAIMSYAQKWEPVAILIEDKASGQSLIQDVKRETKLPILAVGASKGKIDRFAAVSALIEAGKVFLPHSASWLTDYEAEILSFPTGIHDDQVDSTSQYLNWVRGKSACAPRIRVFV